METCYDKIEDSGYHTSLSPGVIDPSFESSSSSLSFLNSCPSSGKHNYFRGVVYTASIPHNECYSVSPNSRRGRKRLYQEDSPSFLTPTREISCKIQKLKVNDRSTNSTKSPFLLSPEKLHYSNVLTTLPTTPVKSCNTNCKVSPYKRGKKLNFNIHSLSCENLQPVQKNKSKLLPVKSIQLKPVETYNIIKKLLDKSIIPPLKIIFNYLENEDIFNFSLAYSDIYEQICNKVSNVEERKNCHVVAIQKIKENKGNVLHGVTAKENNNQRMKLKDITNKVTRADEIYKEKRLKLYGKTETTDLKTQRQLCVICSHPAIVKEEPSGEKWAECVRKSCLHQFCKLCKCKRHPGKRCIEDDLEAVSPSKRRKVFPKDSIGTKKSRKKLLRLQM